MKYFFFQSPVEIRTCIAQFAIADSDWKSMDTAMKSSLMLRMLSQVITFSVEPSALNSFIAQGAESLRLNGVIEIVKTKPAGAVVFTVERVITSTGKIADVRDGDFSRFLEECEDEVTK